MNPTLEEKQNEPAQQKSSTEGTISQGINTINSFARRGFSNPFGKIGQRVVLQAGLRGLGVFLASPYGLVLIVIAVILIFTITIIVGLGGAPPSETIIPTIDPTQTEAVTPTPAVP